MTSHSEHANSKKSATLTQNFFSQSRALTPTLAFDYTNPELHEHITLHTHTHKHTHTRTHTHNTHTLVLNFTCPTFKKSYTIMSLSTHTHLGTQFHQVFRASYTSHQRPQPRVAAVDHALHFYDFVEPLQFEGHMHEED